MQEPTVSSPEGVQVTIGVAREYVPADFAPGTDWRLTRVEPTDDDAYTRFKFEPLPGPDAPRQSVAHDDDNVPDLGRMRDAIEEQLAEALDRRAVAGSEPLPAIQQSFVPDASEIAYLARALNEVDLVFARRPVAEQIDELQPPPELQEVAEVMQGLGAEPNVIDAVVQGLQMRRLGVRGRAQTA